MLRTLDRKLLVLILALPGASFALGLGDIHVDSALHQPLTAQIELVGATQEDLARLSAEIANEETFRRYGLERPPFLFTTVLKVGQDKQGHPVLVLRSNEAFTDPVVTFLVDLHSPSGELIREYTLLLDPEGLAAERSNVGAVALTPEPVLVGSPGDTLAVAASVPSPAAAATVAASAPASRLTAATNTSGIVKASDRPVAALDSKLSGQTYTVARHDTLDRIVSVAGAHTRSDRHRMMIAIFRANPAAFQNNLNRLHTGSTLHIPSAAELSAISADEANREFEAQMEARYAPSHRVPSTAPSNASTVASQTAPPIGADATNSLADAKPDTQSREAYNTALAQRVDSLEKTLGEMKQELKKPLVAQSIAAAATDSAAAAAKSADQSDAVGEAADEADEPAPARHNGMKWLVPLAAGLGLALAAAAWFYRRRRNADSLLEEPVADQDWSTRREAETAQPVKAGVAFPPLPQTASVAALVVKQLNSDAMQPNQGPAVSESNWFKEPGSTASDNPAAFPPTVKLATARTPEVESTLKLAISRIHETETTVRLPAATSLETQATAKLPVANHDAATTAKLSAVAPLDADTLELLEPRVEMVGDTVEQKFSFFNPESSNNTEHVVMGSGLNEPKPFVERRKSPVDVLRQAIEREPDRGDLRLKLLELYYTAAAQNRQAFLEVTRQLVKNEKLASAQEWSQIADMGRAIAPDDKLFSASLDEQEVA